jgi:DNA-binding NarL/FixJ family response regulator
MKIFIVDDSKLMRERIIHLLSGVGGVEIAGQAQNGFEATDRIRKIKPDAVILDIRMPGKNGIDTLQEIKKQNATPLIIMFTNYPYAQYRKKCLKAGADYFLDKSSEFDKLIDVLKQEHCRFNPTAQRCPPENHHWRMPPTRPACSSPHPDSSG